jgi:glycosyltransferase involved in cell wall biosynthesis
MKIGVIFESNISSGGGFQYELSTIKYLNKHKSDKYDFIFISTCKKNLAFAKELGINLCFLKLNKADIYLNYLRKFKLFNILLHNLGLGLSKIDKLCKKEQINLFYFLTPSRIILNLTQCSYIITVWDLCHRDHPEFPEVGLRGFNHREKFYKAVLPRAVKIIAESNLGKKNIIKRYHVDDNRVLIVPFLPSEFTKLSDEDYKKNYIDIKSKYNVEDYIYYPAQFWAHKNHIYILEALKILNEKYNTKLSAIFSGADYGNLNYILKTAKAFGLTDQVKYIGFVDNCEIPYIYKQALALVMPTYFGPTNIPPLEAFALDCPVLYSDLDGLREQVQDAALLLDLNKPESLVHNLLKVIRNDKIIDEIVSNGKNKLVMEEDDCWNAIKIVFDNFETKLKTWKGEND